MKAMILAAGRGERLRPLTDRVPKPLVEAGGQPLILRHLERLAAAGLREVVINVSHLAEAVMARVGDGSAYGLHVAWSREAEALETAGGIANALTLLGPQPFVLVNGDVYTDYDFGRLAKLDLGSRLAHLVLVPNPAHRPDGDFSLVDGVLGNAASPRYTYSGIALLAPALVADLPEGTRAPLAPRLYGAAERGLASGERYEGLWRDVGSAERLAELNALLAARARGQDKE